MCQHSFEQVIGLKRSRRHSEHPKALGEGNQPRIGLYKSEVGGRAPQLEANTHPTPPSRLTAGTWGNACTLSLLQCWLQRRRPGPRQELVRLPPREESAKLLRSHPRVLSCPTQDLQGMGSWRFSPHRPAISLFHSHLDPLLPTTADDSPLGGYDYLAHVLLLPCPIAMRLICIKLPFLQIKKQRI